MKYKILFQEDKKLKKLYLESENIKKEKLPNNIIKIEKIKNSKELFKSSRISTKQLEHFFYELNIMLSANISLSDAFEILSNNRNSQKEREFVKTLFHSINNQKALDYNLNKFKLDPLVFSFFQIVNKKGNLKLSIEALTNLLKFNKEVKAQLFKTLSYPLLLLCTLFVSLFSIFYFVLPSFESLLNQNSIKATTSTTLLFSVKNLILNYALYFFSFIGISFSIFYFLYKKTKPIRYLFDKILILHIPFFSSLFLTFYLYKIFIILNILQKADYEFHDCLDSLTILVKNKYLLDKIAHIENLLKSGRSISLAFESINLFDMVVLNLMQTGEISNRVSFTTIEIEKIYKNKFQEKIKLFSFWVQPLVFMLIMGLILWIIFAIFMPMWNMSNMIMI